MSPKLCVIAALSAVVTLLGCMELTGPPLQPVPARTRSRDVVQSTHQVGAATDRLRLTTRVRASERFMVTGDLAHLVLSVTSHEREPVTLGFPHSCQLLYVVYDWRGTEVSEGYGCLTFPSDLTLRPGETVEQRASWRAKRYDERLRTYVPLPPGRYRIHAFLDRHWPESWSRVGYLSPPFVMRLLGAEKPPGKP